MGGGAAWLTGRAIAATWRPWWHVVGYTLILAAAVRFFHFSLFGGTLLTLHYYLVDLAFCLAIGLLGYRITRSYQMADQYGWLSGRRPDGRRRLKIVASRKSRLTFASLWR